MTVVHKIPQRMCIACRVVENRRALVRIVHTPDGHVTVDATGKANGRGAYLHPSQRCFDEAVRRNRLNSALRTNLREDDTDRLRREFTAVAGDSRNSVSKDGDR